MEKSASSNPPEHTANIKKEFKKLSEHLREDVEKVDDPQAKALFEDSAEVIDGSKRLLLIMKEKMKQPGSI